MSQSIASQMTYNRNWSVPRDQLPDAVLIASVIDDPVFADMVKICLHFGVERVRDIFTRMVQDGELNRVSILHCERMISNIEEGFARANQSIVGQYRTVIDSLGRDDPRRLVFERLVADLDRQAAA